MSLVGCQSMGAMRSSKFLDGRSFHLRKSVHATKMRPTEPAIETSTTSVVFVIFLSLLLEAERLVAPLLVGVAVSVRVD